MVNEELGSHLTGLHVIQKDLADLFETVNVTVKQNYRNSGISSFTDTCFTACTWSDDNSVNVMCKYRVHHALKTFCAFV